MHQHMPRIRAPAVANKLLPAVHYHTDPAMPHNGIKPCIGCNTKKQTGPLIGQKVSCSWQGPIAPLSGQLLSSEAAMRKAFMASCIIEMVL